MNALLVVIECACLSLIHKLTNYIFGMFCIVVSSSNPLNRFVYELGKYFGMKKNNATLNNSPLKQLKRGSIYLISNVRFNKRQ